jgi:biopolymer transport protein TolR
MGPIRGNGGKRLVSDINVTPLVDVMLVLLIIFMVTAPMMTQGIDVDLPKTTSKSLVQKDERIDVVINEEGKFKLKNVEVDRALVVQELNKENNKDIPVYLYADTNVSYGIVVELMGDIKAAGFDKVGLLTKPSDQPLNAGK